MSDSNLAFLRFVIDKKILRFSEVTTKFGRRSPYFFNAGLCADGAGILQLANFYADTIINSRLQFDMLFGPAYKGIVLAATTAMALAARGINLPYAYNRKEAKDHGEEGILVGAPLAGRVLIIDDVISAGTSIRESVALIKSNKACPSGVVVALDRMEKGLGEKSATREITDLYNLPVTAIANLDDLLELIQEEPQLQPYQDKIKAYRRRFGVTAAG